MTKVGYTWLIERLGLKTRPLLHASYIGPRMSRKESQDGRVEEHYIRSYDPGDRILDHVVFALKYDGLDLDILSKVLRRITAAELTEFVVERPSSKFTKQIGYWFEALTGQELPSKVEVSGNYELLLNPEHFVVSDKPIRNRRWRLMNNAVGTGRFLPLIRRTAAIRAIEQQDWIALISRTLAMFPEDLLHRALSYFYFKETKSSFAIEKEEPGAARTGKFVSLLNRAGLVKEPLSEATLAELQNGIVDERYREAGFRARQNYVGQSTAYFREIVHTIGVPPDRLRDVMEGLAVYYRHSSEVNPILRAAVISFAFVFIHPFEDGNGRLHRYLIHDPSCLQSLMIR
jgi:hypothetical protein